MKNHEFDAQLNELTFSHILPVVSSSSKHGSQHIGLFCALLRLVDELSTENCVNMYKTVKTLLLEDPKMITREVCSLCALIMKASNCYSGPNRQKAEI